MTDARFPSHADPIGAFKAFHASLCRRFGYAHDEQFWWRDLVSLEEHIAQTARSVGGGELRQLVQKWRAQSAKTSANGWNEAAEMYERRAAELESLADSLEGDEVARIGNKHIAANCLPVEARAAESVGTGAWRPIDDAPRDGTVVLATDGLHFATITWTDGFKHTWTAFRATHWQPLPEPPK